MSLVPFLEKETAKMFKPTPYGPSYSVKLISGGNPATLRQNYTGSQMKCFYFDF